MAENIDEAMMRKFLHRVFRKSNNVGNLTVKSLRQQFLGNFGLEKLEADQREVFKNIVHDVYAFYSNNNQEKTGDQESNVEDSQTADDSSDATASSSSASSKLKKRKRGIDSDEESPQKHHTTVGETHTEEICDNNDNMSEDEEQRDTTLSGIETVDKQQINQRKIISSKKSSQKVNGKSKLNDLNGEDKEQRKRSSSSKRKTSQESDEDAESGQSGGDEEITKDKSTSRKKKTLEESDEDAEISGESSSDEEVMGDKTTSKKKKSLEESDEDAEMSGGSSNDKEVTRDKTTSKQKKTLEESSEDAESGQSSHDSDDEINEQKQGAGKKNGHKPKQSNVKVNDDEDHTWKKKQRRKSKDTSPTEKKTKSSPPTVDSMRLKNLKRFVRTCGLHKNYIKLFAECKSMSQKEKTLERVLRKDTGFEGRITLGMCKKFKKAKEEADEIAELDCSNIITTDGGRRPTRSSRVGSDSKPTPCAVPNSDSGPKLFSRLKGVVDSDSSDSEDEQNRGKHATNTSPDKKNSQGNCKKRRRLDSSSDDEGD